MTKERIVLAYTGEPDAGLLISRLQQEHRADIVTLTIDVGQRQELDQVREQALAGGAIRAHVLDAREEFARRYILPALQAGALYGGRYPLTSSLARPLVAAKLVEIARIESAAAVAHGTRALDNDLRILTPLHSGPGGDSPARYRVDENLWGRSIEEGALDDPWQEAAEDIFRLTKPATLAPDAPAYVEVTFERGVPAAVNGVSMPFPELIESLTTIAGSHGVGRIDTIERRRAGIVSREICEAPAAVVLHAAHRELETLVLERDVERLKQELSLKYADLVYNGLWFTPMREALDAFTRTVQEPVTGTIRVKLFKGSCEVVGRSTRSSGSRAAEPIADPASRVPTA
jgi:argininosuccinate synthase